MGFYSPFDIGRSVSDTMHLSAYALALMIIVFVDKYLALLASWLFSFALNDYSMRNVVYKMSIKYWLQIFLFTIYVISSCQKYPISTWSQITFTVTYCNQAWNDNLRCYTTQHKLIELGWLDTEAAHKISTHHTCNSWRHIYCMKNW